MITNAEIVGAGPMWQGTPHPKGTAEYPDPYAAGTAIGQHLRVERLLRVSENRHYYLVNNLGPKWSRRKCWACGNKYTPNRAQSCDYCMTPLRDLRFIMTSRWDRDEFFGFEQLVKQRLRIFGLVTPVALIYRGPFQLAIYHYHNEALLLDEPSPLEPHTLLTMSHQLGQVLHKLHDNGVVLRRLGPENILLMPDGSTRLFDIDTHGVAGNRDALARHRRRPIEHDTQALGDLLQTYCAPEYHQLSDFFSDASAGKIANPGALARAVEERLFSGGARAVETAASAFADVGLLRCTNQDNWTWDQLTDQTRVYVIADGMGGHEDGDIASALAAKTVIESLRASFAKQKKTDRKTLEKSLSAAIHAANDVVGKQAAERDVNMGTTLVIALVHANEFVVIGNAGDSRCYRLRLGKLEQLSVDHSIVAELVAAGRLSKEEARNHKNSHILTSTVGAGDELEVDTVVEDCMPGDRLLLCSDGLWGEIPEKDLAYILGSQPDRRHCIQALVRAAYEAGGHDNISMCILDIL